MRQNLFNLLQIEPTLVAYYMYNIDFPKLPNFSFDFEINWLVILVFVNLTTIVVLACLKDIIEVKKASLWSAWGQLFTSGLMLCHFDFSRGEDLQFTIYNYHFSMGDVTSLREPLIIFGMDGLGMGLLILSLVLGPVCILCSWVTIKYKIKEFQILVHFTMLCLIGAFSAQDLLFFYLFFETLLVPVFFYIGTWGTRDRKIHANYQLFLYTIATSIPLLLGIAYIYSKVGSANCEVLAIWEFSFTEKQFLWLCMMLCFMVKVPLVPFHIWLPEAHVEATTAGSVFLAGIVLKVGCYGLIKFPIVLFPEITEIYKPIGLTCCALGGLYATYATTRQVDLKKLVAYSSVGHMSLVGLGIFGGTYQTLAGSVVMMIGHGIVSAALFLQIGALYERYSTRVIMYYGGLIFGMPSFGIFFLYFTFANISLPGTSNFVGEFLILLGTGEDNVALMILATVSIILGAVYAIWLYNRVMFGILKDGCNRFSDSNKRELLLLVVLTSISFLIGLYPSCITDYLDPYIIKIVLKRL